MPPWEAVTVQLPAAVMWTVLPAIVQLSEGPTEKLTPSPELAEALTVKSGSPYVRPGRVANVIVWLALAAATFSVTCTAASKFAFPAWL